MKTAHWIGGLAAVTFFFAAQHVVGGDSIDEAQAAANHKAEIIRLAKKEHARQQRNALAEKFNGLLYPIAQAKIEK